MINTDHDVEDVSLLHWCCHYDPFGAALQMAIKCCMVQELAGAFKHNLDTIFAPRNVIRDRVSRKSDTPVVDAERPFRLGRDGTPPTTLDRVELEQMCSGRHTSLDFIDMHDVEAIAASGVIVTSFCSSHGCPECQATDSTHAIDADAHADFLFAFMLWL
jgi:hypothetical protein